MKFIAEFGSFVLDYQFDKLLSLLILYKLKKSEKGLLELLCAGLAGKSVDEIFSLDIILTINRGTPFMRLAITMLNLT